MYTDYILVFITRNIYISIIIIAHNIYNAAQDACQCKKSRLFCIYLEIVYFYFSNA